MARSLALLRGHWCRKRNLSLKYMSTQRTPRFLTDESVDTLNEVLTSKLPIVCLESTIITHGMPNPINIETALKVEEIIRNQGAVPATIGIVKGRIKFGMTSSDFTELVSGNTSTVKVSKRDLPYVVSKGLNGGTTVAATAYIASLAGIDVVVTGGIGGVHRNAAESFDISNDLIVLGQHCVSVVCSGVKSILDIPRTLEYLETQGVTVATLGPTTDFPAFYSRVSGCHSPYKIESAAEAADLIYNTKKFKSTSGVVIAVPIPHEFEIPCDEIEKPIQESVEEAARQNVIGKDITPFILDYVSQRTAGRSLKANIALIQNNAKVGAEIARELQLLRGKGSKFFLSSDTNQQPQDHQH